MHAGPHYVYVVENPIGIRILGQIEEIKQFKMINNVLYSYLSTFALNNHHTYLFYKRIAILLLLAR